MTDHHNEELLGLLDRIKEFVRAEVYPLPSLSEQVVHCGITRLIVSTFFDTGTDKRRSAGICVYPRL